MLNIDEIRGNYPILEEKINNRNLIYLDNAATMQMPLPVIRTIQDHYMHKNGNVHRGMHYLSTSSSNAYEQARKTVSDFIAAENPETIIFTSGTTESINMAARMLSQYTINENDEILVTEMEHHSNLIVWQEICKKRGAIFRYVPVMKDGTLDSKALEDLICDKTKVVSFTHLSNITGIRNPIENIIRIVRQRSNAAILIDGAQGIRHEAVDVKKLDCDFYCFSGHKVGGPTGIGILYMKEKWLDILEPVNFGGGMVYQVSMMNAKFLDHTSRFEAGTPNYVGAIGLKAAIDYISSLNTAELISYESNVIGYLEEKLLKLNGIQIIGKTKVRKGTLSFIVDGVHSYDLVKFLDQYGIAIRSGHHCAQPYLKAMGYEQCCRVSPAFYNTLTEIDVFVEVLQSLTKILRK